MEGQATTNEEVYKGASASGARRGKTARGDSNALKRVKKSIEDANFYEALQLIKMLTSRCLFHPPHPVLPLGRGVGSALIRIATC
jgi:hypothetical protein